LFDEIRVTVERSGQQAVPVPIGEAGECLDKEVLPLVPAEDSDADQMAGDGLGRSSDPIDARPGDMHPVGLDRYRVKTSRRVHSLVTTTPAAARSTHRSERSAPASWCVDGGG